MNNKLFICFALIVQLICFDCSSKEISSPSVLIIGAGPGGLATAIQAHQAGAQVTLVEKRPSYTRRHKVRITKHSLNLLEKWGIVAPELILLPRGPGRGAASIEIRQLENALNRKISELKINKIQGEFIDLNADSKTAIILSEGKQILAHYDIIIGADGAHSRLREKAGIKNEKIQFKVYCAQFFSLKTCSALLIGDAAASSPYQMGTNIALGSAEAVGVFVRQGGHLSQEAYQQFDLAIQDLVDSLLVHSKVFIAYLWLRFCLKF